MVWLVDGYAMKRWVQSHGWRRVGLSQAVWEWCVVVPEGIEGQSEDLRIWDLLCFLHGAIRRGSILDRFNLDHADFVTSVLNDNRDWDDSCEWIPTEVELVAMRGADEYGAPCIVVTLPDENCPR